MASGCLWECNFKNNSGSLGIKNCQIKYNKMKHNTHINLNLNINLYIKLS